MDRKKKETSDKERSKKRKKSPEEEKRISIKKGNTEIDEIFAKKRIQTCDKTVQKKRKPSDATTSVRSILEKEFKGRSSSDWVDDGLGGKFNFEGYTGRVQDGIKIFKAHVLNRPTAGKTKLCPFECDCCFI